MIQEPSIAPIRISELSKGHAGAQYNLGFMYANSPGVPQDDVLAHMWSNLTASRMTGEGRESIVSDRDRLRAKMTAEQVVEAQRHAREWDAAHPREPQASSTLNPD